MNDRVVGALRDVLSTVENVELAVVFGSCAKGSASAASDLDLALLPRGELNFDAQARLIDLIERATARDVDLVRLDRVDDVVLRREVALHGVVVREAHAGAFARFRAEAQLEWLDLEPLYRDAETRFLRRLAGRRE